jgi:hypothetical protein
MPFICTRSSVLFEPVKWSCANTSEHRPIFIDKSKRTRHHHRPRGGNNMADKKEEDNPRKKRTIEFDWFVRDLEPEQDEKIRGGSGKQSEPEKESDKNR